MQISDTLIEKFLNGRCTKAEAAFVSRYFRKNPEAAAKYLISNWNAADAESELPYDYKELMLLEIGKKTFQSKTRNAGRIYIRMGLRLAVAAASVILVYWGFREAQPENVKREKIAFAEPRLNSPAKVVHKGEISGGWTINTNRTDQKLKMKLEDGSVVTLLPRSSIRYASHFSDNMTGKRDVYLQGQAFFDVTRDKSRPFTVYAGNMSTTVLGTSFSVQENETGVLVKLYSGKVMVHTVRHNTWNKDILLLPGEQLRYDTSANLTTVTTFVIEKPVRKISHAAATDDSSMVFDNTALPDVMTKLIDHYHTPIVFNKAELSDMYFSGQVLESDSLSVILKVIANMNGLKITQTTDGFMVHSSEE
ncbi:MAG: FecR domain-containing protein [Bacteroidota bacterium]|nr:FecR domain-containing protein [Bacteroidota bacterium]MDP4211675.1 FecR domain-containing protein [Bacteroidota bacterium]MDP4250458.1 FecR domain-containing protein [Bacteroidota bacterium]